MNNCESSPIEPESQALNSDLRSQWFAMSAPYRRELRAKEELSGLGIENFIPMRNQAVRRRNGTTDRELVPAIHNLIFVHCTREAIRQVKLHLRYIQYLTRPENGRRVPIIVPDADMERFIAVTRTYNDSLIYLRPDEVDLRKGTPVRIIGGQFDGIEGTFIKVKGHRSRRVVILAKDVIGVALEVQPDLIEILP